MLMKVFSVKGHARLLSVSEETMLSSGMPSRIAIPVSLAGHHIAAAQAAAAQASAQAQAAALEQLREKLESGEPPEKKVVLMAEEQQRFMQHALQQNLLAMASQLPMNITINNRGRQMSSGPTLRLHVTDALCVTRARSAKESGSTI